MDHPVDLHSKTFQILPNDLPLPQEILVSSFEISEELLGPLRKRRLLLRDGVGLHVDLVQSVNGVFGVVVVAVRDDILDVDALPLLGHNSIESILA